MAQSKFIQSVVQAAQGRPRSTDWYKDKIREFGKPGALDLIRDGKRKKSPFYGRLNMFFYDPKFKKTLPYYDTFPLVLPLEPYSDGFLGINLHYLPMKLRLQLLDRLVDYSNNTKFDESTILDVDYSKLKNVNLIKPTLKRYLAGRVKTDFRRIDADEFMVAALLPVQRFKKGSASEVYSDSRKMI
jgi:hypothetical protein|tara:strand:- start:490 stop:1047 length:558 start_codon:yes stop_codon:yes gene_type:complete